LIWGEKKKEKRGKGGYLRDAGGISWVRYPLKKWVSKRCRRKKKRRRDFNEN